MMSDGLERHPTTGRVINMNVEGVHRAMNAAASGTGRRDSRPPLSLPDDQERMYVRSTAGSEKSAVHQEMEMAALESIASYKSGGLVSTSTPFQSAVSLTTPARKASGQMPSSEPLLDPSHVNMSLDYEVDGEAVSYSIRH